MNSSRSGNVLVLLALVWVLSVQNGWCLNPDKVKIAFLKGEYKAAIREGESLLAGARKSSSRLDELYYYLGVCYLKDGNALRAADIFDIIGKEFKRSPFLEQSQLGAVDAAIALGEYARADRLLKQFSSEHPRTKFRADVQQRVDQVAAKQVAEKTSQPAVTQEVINSAMQKDFQAAVSQAVKDAGGTNEKKPVFVIQVGAFTSKINAGKLAEKLSRQGYAVIVAEALSGSRHIFKVRVGNYASRDEAVAAEKVLKQKGYPTKILP
ncbi:MAG TPA: SPOR domain-containing protein [Candidatus Omnitrophota bacterium]|nr:SPOR domain-containing protein [Candidatus Omnitrophota bacterium]HRZ15825.1 SPOR domain-containing protein [Candidatus Omnitrophota bacterium]